jgi:xylulokinase
VYFLAIDLGTQSIKVALTNQQGEILTLSQQSQEVYSPKSGWAQQKPDLWWKLTKKAILEVTKSAPSETERIKGICTCGQMHGPVGIRDNGEITTEWTQTWMDKRCEDICNSIRSKNEELELAKITGNPITAGWVGIKVRWIKENQPDVYDRTQCFLVPKDFINYQLTHATATDYSEASGTYLFDAAQEQYSRVMAEILDVDLDKFASIRNSYESIGTIREDLAQEFGLPRDTPVFAGGGDFIVSLLGLGIGRETAIDMTGTSTLFVVNKDKPIINPAVQNLRHVMGGWLPFTMLDCGGLAMKWCKDFLSSIGMGDVSYEQMIQLAENIPEGCEGLIFYPYLLGERRADNVFAKGCFYGMTLNHRAGHIARSVMEGVALALGKDLQIFKNLGVNIKQVNCVGGATRNKLLYQIKADVMQLPQIISEEPEASLRGCTLLAAYGSGAVKNLDEINLMNNKNTISIKPNPKVKEIYKNLQKKFIKMYDHLLGYWTE